MFKKTKRSMKNKSSFRHKNKRNNTFDDDDDGDDGMTNSSSTINARKHVQILKSVNVDTNATDNVDDESEDEESTSNLLAQLKKESLDKNNNKNISKKRRRTMVSTATTNEKKSSSSSSSLSSWSKTKRYSVMHEYAVGSGPNRPTAKDMATLTAEYHPKDKINNEDQTKGNPNDDNTDDGIYRGRKEKRSKFLAGPLRAPTFVRTTCRFDYQPDICKDYKETGFCGFGDTCIYLHDRGDTLTGWQLENQWEEKKRLEREKKEREMNRFVLESGDGETTQGGEEGGDIDNGFVSRNVEDDGIPFACYICRGPFLNPIVTMCGHYFCQKCITEHFKTDSQCPVCKKDTLGVFNHPTKLHAKKRRMVGSDAGWEEFAERR